MIKIDNKYNIGDRFTGDDNRVITIIGIQPYIEDGKITINYHITISRGCLYPQTTDYLSETAITKHLENGTLKPFVKPLISWFNNIKAGDKLIVWNAETRKIKIDCTFLESPTDGNVLVADRFSEFAYETSEKDIHYYLSNSEYYTSAKE